MRASAASRRLPAAGATATVGRVKAQRLQHVSVEVPPALLETCVRFYVEVLGMRRIPNPAGAAWFTFGDGDHVHLLEGAPRPDAGAHMGLVVDELDQLLDRARAAGVEPRASDDLWGSPRWFLRDPAGNRIELFTRPPRE
jgi:catechol 2,3-dioxygenase-like lactoylglutathione lyase family enzyme